MRFKFWPDYDSIFMLDACQHTFLVVHCEAKQSLKHSTLAYKVKDIELRVNAFASFIQKLCFPSIPPTAVTQVESHGKSEQLAKSYRHDRS